MESEKHEVIMSTILNQLPDLYLAELHQVSEFIKGLKLARKFHK